MAKTEYKKRKEAVRDCVKRNETLEAVTRRYSAKKVFLEVSQNSQENTCARVSFLIKLLASGCNFIEKETLAHVFSCEFCEVSENTFYYRTPLVAASETLRKEKNKTNRKF